MRFIQRVLAAFALLIGAGLMIGGGMCALFMASPTTHIQLSDRFLVGGIGVAVLLVGWLLASLGSKNVDKSKDRHDP